MLKRNRREQVGKIQKIIVKESRREQVGKIQKFAKEKQKITPSSL